MTIRMLGRSARRGRSLATDLPRGGIVLAAGRPPVRPTGRVRGRTPDGKGQRAVTQGSQRTQGSRGTQATHGVHGAGWLRPTLHGSQLRGGQLTLEQKAALARRYGYAGLDYSLAEVRAYPGGADGVRALLQREGLRGSTVGGVLGARLT